MLQALKHRLFRAFGDACIKRAMKTPYFHLYHDDGSLYMERYWLFRIGAPRNVQALRLQIANLSIFLRNGNLSPAARAYVTGRLEALEREIQPRYAIRVHRIVSSDEPVMHDHPWDYTSLILRGGYIETRPNWTEGLTPGHIVADDTAGGQPEMHGAVNRQWYGAGALLNRRAQDWHYLTLPAGSEAWTLFCTGAKQQEWGFLINGFKVRWTEYLRRRRARFDLTRADDLRDTTSEATL